MKFYIVVRIRYIVTTANFGDHQFRRFQMAGVEVQVFPLTFNVILLIL